MTHYLYQISNKRFVAGIVVANNICTKAAPIIHRDCFGKTLQDIESYCKRNGYYIERVV